MTAGDASRTGHILFIAEAFYVGGDMPETEGLGLLYFQYTHKRLQKIQRTGGSLTIWIERLFFSLRRRRLTTPFTTLWTRARRSLNELQTCILSSLKTRLDGVELILWKIGESISILLAQVPREWQVGRWKRVWVKLAGRRYQSQKEGTTRLVK